MRRAKGTLLLVGCLLFPVHLPSQVTEHPLLRPNSYGTNPEGAYLECAVLLEADPTYFSERAGPRSVEEGRKCVNQLVESLTPEPDFTAKDFETAILEDPHHDLLPSDPQLAARMMRRLAVNINASQAFATLAREGVIDDPSTLRPLIRCLKHPLWQVAQNCHFALFALTWHTWGGWNFFSNASSTQEQRERIVSEWTDWENKLHNGHPLFDDWLKSEVLKTANLLGTRLESALKNASTEAGRDDSCGIASGYIHESLAANPRLHGYDTVFELVVGDHSVDNWPQGTLDEPTVVQAIGVRIFRPDVDASAAQPAFSAGGGWEGPDDVVFKSPEGVYSETFPALDLTAQVAIRTKNDRLRKSYLSAARDGLAELRAANVKAAGRE